MAEEKRPGFAYHLDPETIRRYQAWPLERRLEWLMAGNRLRRAMPPEKRAMQDELRAEPRGDWDE